MSESSIIEKKTQFEDSPEGWQARWTVEMAASDKELGEWWKKSEEILKIYLDDRVNTSYNQDISRANLFTANIQTTRCLLYGQTPKVEVVRRFADAGDSPARMAGEILERLLNTDIERDSDTYTKALFNALDDWLLPGLGNVRVRYEKEVEERDEVPAIMHPETGVELAPAYTPEPTVTSEEVAVDYLHWKDQRWSPCRHYDEVRWWAYKAEMTRDALHARFDGALGADEVDRIPLDAKDSKDQSTVDGSTNNPWARAQVWEIWNKDERKVYFWVKGASRVLDIVDDPLGLDGFFPHPEPMFANLTTSKLLPRPDYVLAQDQYNEVNEVTSRITLLEKALVVRGVYDKTAEDIKRLISEGQTNDLIPVDNWAMFAEKGGLKGVVDWLPLEMIAGTLDKLREYRAELIGLLYQITGMSDIMRGQSSGQTTATEQAIKAKFASVRMQFRQGEFARFASDVQKLKAEIIAKHFNPQTIIQRANVQFMAGVDQQAAQAAVKMIKDDFYQYRVEVKPEAISMADYAAVKQERSEMLTAMATFLQSALPVMQALPPATPMLFQTLQWTLAGFRGGSTIEGVIDQGIIQIQQYLQQKLSQPPPPDPKVQQMQMQAQIDQRAAQMDMAGKQQDMQIKQQTAVMDLAHQREKLKLDLLKTQMDHQAKQQEHALNQQVAQRAAEMDMASQARRIASDERKADMDAVAAQSKHELNLEMMRTRAEAMKNPAGGSNAKD